MESTFPFQIYSYKNDFPFLRLPIFSRNVRPNDDDDDISEAVQVFQLLSKTLLSLVTVFFGWWWQRGSSDASTPLSLYNMIFSITSRTKVFVSSSFLWSSSSSWRLVAAPFQQQSHLEQQFSSSLIPPFFWMESSAAATFPSYLSFTRPI